MSTEAAAEPLALRAATLCEAFLRTSAERGDAVALRTPRDGVTITWREYRERVARIAAGLAALGVGRGDTVGLMLLNRPELQLVDTAALHLGAAPFSLYNTATAEQLGQLFANAGNRVVVTEHAFLPAIGAARRRSQRLEHVVVVDRADYGALTLAALESHGALDLRRAAGAVAPEDVATIVYTPGTTGPPKGVELTHANVLAACRAAAARLPGTPGGRAASFMPSADLADRWCSHYHLSLMYGATVTSIADPRTIAIHLPDARPSAWAAPPRTWEKLRAGLQARGVADPAALSERERAALRRRIGLDRARWLLCCAAPCPRSVLEFFDALGLPILETWGMAETAGHATVNPPTAPRPGTCGTALDGSELRLAGDGEVLVRGPLVMAGYRGEPALTAAAIDADGWLHTGDVGTLDAEVAGHFAAERGIADASTSALAGHPAVRDALAEAVRIANRRLARAEQVKAFAIVGDDWPPGGDELTPAGKLRRAPIARRYAGQVDALYAERRPDDLLAAL